MAEQAAMAAPFPAPPPFYKHFTKQNLARLKQIRKEAGITDSATAERNDEKTDVDILSLPPELRYLVPPDPPINGKFSSFGTSIDLNAPEPTLQEAGIEQLYPADANVRLNPQPQLIALARSLLTTFLSLTGILAQDPVLYEDRATDLQTIMYNMHDLINQYRPHQARESLILMMEERVEKMKAEIASIDESRDKVAKLLQGLQEGELAHKMEDEAEEKHKIKESAEVAKRKARQRAAWEALETEMG